MDYEINLTEQEIASLETPERFEDRNDRLQLAMTLALGE